MKTLLIITSVLLLVSCNNKSEKKGENTTKQEVAETGSQEFGLDEVNLEASLKARVKDYFHYTMNLEFEKLMDYIYPKVFEQASREEMIKEINASFENEEMKAQIDSINVEKVSPSIKVDGGEYIKLYYSMNMVFDFKGDLEEDKKIYEQMAVKFGSENVTMDPNTGTISIWQKDSMVAAKDNISKDWTFVSAKDEMVDAIFSDAVLDKLDELE